MIANAAQDAPFVFLANIDPDLQIEVLRQVRQPKLTALEEAGIVREKAPNETFCRWRDEARGTGESPAPPSHRLVASLPIHF